MYNQICTPNVKMLKYLSVHISFNNTFEEEWENMYI